MLEKEFDENIFSTGAKTGSQSLGLKRVCLQNSNGRYGNDMNFNFNYAGQTGPENAVFAEDMGINHPEPNPPIANMRKGTGKPFARVKKETSLIGKRPYEASVNYETESGLGRPIGDRSFKDLSHLGTHLQDNAVQTQIPKEFSGDLYGYIKQCIKRANQELDQEKVQETDIAQIDMGLGLGNLARRELPEENNDSEQDEEERTVRLKIDFEPMGDYISQTQYPELKREVLDAVKRISEKYAGQVNLEIQIKDLIPQTQVFSENSADPNRMSWVPNPDYPERSQAPAILETEIEEGPSVAERIIGKNKDESCLILREELFNILENSFDKKVTLEKKENVREQIVKATYIILKNLNCSSEKEYYKENFFNFFNLQLALDPRRVRSFSLKMKIRIACLLFCKYVNRSKTNVYFEEFYPFVNISDLESAKKSIQA